jgi:hypothetical protein
VVTGFHIATGRVVIDFISQVQAGGTQAHTAATSRIYFKAADRDRTIMYNLGGTQTPIPPISYQLENVRLKVLSVTPPPAYAEGLLKASQSEAGFSMDLQTFSVIQINQENVANGMIAPQIDSMHTRARSVVVQTLRAEGARAVGTRSFAGIYDNAQEYQIQFGADHYPSRFCDLRRYAQGKTQPFHLAELEKGLSAASIPVRSLQNARINFLIARGFAAMGQVSDLSAESLSLRIRYANATQKKLINCAIHHLVRLTISASGVTATI